MAPDTRRNILFIDDNADLRESLSAQLRAEGFTVTAAGSGPEGLKATTRETFDLILLDMLMPDQDGIATYQDLRANATTRKTPVILFTGLAVEGHWEALPQEGDGPCYVMGKPYDMLLLLTRISQLLSQPR
jgi:CheY-like chemotaxis protein